MLPVQLAVQHPIEGGAVIKGFTSYALALGLMLTSPLGLTASLPGEVGEVSLHYYTGDDIDISSTRLLVRKHVKNQYGVTLTHNVENISDSSSDVTSQASVDSYTEDRNETGLGLDFLNDGTLIQVQTSYSHEPDYESSILHFDIFQDMYGSTSTFGFGFSRGWDIIGRVDTETEWDINHQNLRFYFSQDMSKFWVTQFDFEHMSEQGYLGNPYLAAQQDGALVSQKTPSTRSQNSLAFTSRVFLEPRAVASINYRYTSDTWNIKSHTIELTYIQPVRSRWEFDVHYRMYRQNEASFFYNDADQAYTYMTRDKKLSNFVLLTFGAIFSYDWGKSLGEGFESLKLNLSFDIMNFTYDNYTPIGSRQPHQFDAKSIQFYLSWRF